ncbi:hypothetical protein ACOIFA_32825, partial [Klebsiella pneumoniae]|uniref:hypothetical protein n=1 Tax=Klebsiella pneumoniae TaxID=573 RepID=UPI003B5C05BD
IRYAKGRFFAIYCPVKEANRFIKKRFPPGRARFPHLTLKCSEIKFFRFSTVQCDLLRFILQLFAVLCHLLRQFAEYLVMH